MASNQSPLKMVQDASNEGATCYGWLERRVGARVVLVTNPHYIQFGYSKKYKYNWEQVTACFKTKFILTILEKLVIVMSDGRFIVLPGSIAVLSEEKGRFNHTLKENNTGGTAFENIYTQFNSVAKIKKINSPPQACMAFTPLTTAVLLGFAVWFLKDAGVNTITVSIVLSLVTLFTYEIYCLYSLTSLVKKLVSCKYNHNASIAKFHHDNL